MDTNINDGMSTVLLVGEENERYDTISSFLPRLRPTTVLSLGICVMYTAYNASLGVMEAAFGATGALSLTLLYAFYSISALFLAPKIVQQRGTRYALIWSGICFLPYYVARWKTPQYTVLCLITSVLFGLAAGVLWTAQGSFMSSAADESGVGYRAGMFYMLLQLSQVGGNLLTTVLLQEQVLYSSLFLVYGVLSCLGVLLLYALLPDLSSSGTRMAERSHVHANNGEKSSSVCDSCESTPRGTPNVTRSAHPDTTIELSTPKRNSVLASLLSLFRFIFDHPDLAEFLPVAAWSGFSVGLWFSFFPGHVVGPTLGVQRIGLVMTGVGLADSVMSYILGLLCDRTTKEEGKGYHTLPDSEYSGNINAVHNLRDTIPQLVITPTNAPSIVSPASLALSQSRHNLILLNLCVTVASLGMLYLPHFAQSVFGVAILSFVIGTANSCCNVFLLYYGTVAFSAYPAAIVFGSVQGMQALCASLSMYLASSVSKHEMVTLAILICCASSVTYLDQSHDKNDDPASEDDSNAFNAEGWIE